MILGIPVMYCKDDMTCKKLHAKQFLMTLKHLNTQLNTENAPYYYHFL